MTIQTTKEVAGDKGLPFASTDIDDSNLRRLIDQVCQIQQNVTHPVSCDDDAVVYVEPDAGGGAAAQLVQPRGERQRAARAAGYSRGGQFTSKFQPGNCPIAQKAGQTCDEFPFWSTNQAVDLSGTLADLRFVPGHETKPQADDIIGFYSKCKVANQDNFIVLPIRPWIEAGGPSFGFRIDTGGTSVCMKPGS